MDLIQIYSIIFMFLNAAYLFVEAGREMEKEDSLSPIVVPFIVLAIWAPIFGRLFSWW